MQRGALRLPLGLEAGDAPGANSLHRSLLYFVSRRPGARRTHLLLNESSASSDVTLQYPMQFYVGKPASRFRRSDNPQEASYRLQGSHPHNRLLPYQSKASSQDFPPQTSGASSARKVPAKDRVPIA